MTSYSIPLPIEEKKGFFDKLSSGAESFNRKISPILQAGSNAIQTGRLALGLGGVGLGTASAIYEFGRSLSARKADTTLQSYAQDVYKNPQILDNSLLEKVTPHLNTLGNFIDVYQGGRSLMNDASFGDLSERHQSYKQLFNPANYYDNISRITAQNKQQEYLDTQRQLGLMSGRNTDDILSSIDSDIQTARAPSFLTDIKQTFNKMAFDRFITSSDVIDNLLNSYMTNIDRNTMESTRIAIQSVKALSKLVRETGDPNGIRALNKLKYDLAVRLKRWAE